MKGLVYDANQLSLYFIGYRVSEEFLAMWAHQQSYVLGDCSAGLQTSGMRTKQKYQCCRTSNERRHMMN